MGAVKALVVGAAAAGAIGYLAQRSSPRPGQLSGFTSPDGEARYLRAYQAVLAHWPVPYRDLIVSTPFGDTHIVVSGEGGKPPLVLLHATGTSATGWVSNVGPLSKQHQVFAVDIVGEAGRSRQTALLRDRADCVLWLSTVLDGLGLNRVSLMGWSFGGWTATAFLLAQPARVNRCVLLAPYASLAPHAPAVKAFLKIGPYLPFGPPGRLALHLMSPSFQFEERFATQFSLGGRYFRAADPRSSVFPVPYPDAELRSITAPVLLILGDRESTFDPHLAAERARTLIPTAQVTLLPGVGHMVALEAAEVVNTQALPFLGA
jgi:pimeloyl-ACP methyl ester carboxylesterase